MIRAIEFICVAILIVDGFITSIKMHHKEIGGWGSLCIYLWALAWYALQPVSLLTTTLLLILAVCAVEHRRRGVNGVLS